ncbi:hypothetical protein LINPERPRIM_LOCUS26931, partial [Linum perenne]
TTHPPFRRKLILRPRRGRRLRRGAFFISHPNRLVIRRPHQVREIQLSLSSPHLESSSIISQRRIFRSLVSTQPYPRTVSLRIPDLRRISPPRPSPDSLVIRLLRQHSFRLMIISIVVNQLGQNVAPVISVKEAGQALGFRVKRSLISECRFGIILEKVVADRFEGLGSHLICVFQDL